MVELPRHLTNDDLLAATSRLAADERATVAALVAHLAEIDARRLAVAAGYSLFTYCREVLLLSEDAAGNRTTAARMVRAFPSVLPMLADGRLNLSTLRVLAPHLTPENNAELVAEAAGQSKRRVEEMVARRFPQVVTTSIRRMPQPRARSAEPMASEPKATAGTSADSTAGGRARQLGHRVARCRSPRPPEGLSQSPLPRRRRPPTRRRRPQRRERLSPAGGPRRRWPRTCSSSAWRRTALWSTGCIAPRTCSLTRWRAAT